MLQRQTGLSGDEPGFNGDAVSSRALLRSCCGVRELCWKKQIRILMCNLMQNTCLKFISRSQVVESSFLTAFWHLALFAHGTVFSLFLHSPAFFVLLLEFKVERYCFRGVLNYLETSSLHFFLSCIKNRINF